MSLRPLRVLSACVAAALLVVSCSSGDGEQAQPLVVVRSPEFVNRILPGHRPLAIVTATGGTGGAASLTGTSTMSGLTVSFVPQTLAPGASVEVWVDVPEVSEDVPFTVTVTAERGKERQSLTVGATAVPGVDDIAETATQIAAVFLDRLHDQLSGLPADVSGLVNGTPVAGLLVVTHYAWFTDTYEIGLAWHIMVAPDDFAEFYVRPRGERAPTHTYRINSWSTALAGGAYEFTEVTPLSEVVR